MRTKSKSPQKKAPYFKCKLCGELVKVTRWRKHIVIKHGIGKLISYRDYFVDDTKRKCKCKLCSKIYPKEGWRDHLVIAHKIGGDLKFRDYYISEHNASRPLNQYNKKKTTIEKDWHCGDVLNGPPKVFITYNAICTNRRKH